MNNFIYETPTKVYFGKDEELKVGQIIKEYGATKVLIHYGRGSAKKSGLIERVERVEQWILQCILWNDIFAWEMIPI